MSSKNLFALDFEVFGIVQGVYFRKYTEKQAQKLGLRGWCMNTPHGTVKGQLEGPQNELNEMKHWLQNKGSPNSRIESAVFGEMLTITHLVHFVLNVSKIYKAYFNCFDLLTDF